MSSRPNTEKWTDGQLFIKKCETMKETISLSCRNHVENGTVCPVFHKDV